MPAKVRVLKLWDYYIKNPGVEIVSTVSKSKTSWEKGLSPFVLGPCQLYDTFVSQNMENAWQYCKVYKEYLDDRGVVDHTYWKWAMEGWANPKAVRYPVGKGRKPEFSLWGYRRFGYVEARKVIYGPLYAKAVLKTESYKRLRKLYRNCDELILLDYDAYDHRKEKKTLTEVLNDPNKKMGHAFVLAMLLTMDDALGQFEDF